MKVNIDKTLEVTDEQRRKISSVLDQKVGKRDATRDEMKEFIWAHGRDWEMKLDDQYSDLTGESVPDEPEDDDELDLIGASDEDLDDLSDLI